MRKLVAALLGVIAVSAWAEDAPAYVTYAPQPLTTAIGFQDADFQWMKDVAALLPPEGFTFLGRRDSGHWMALTDKGGWWLLQIRDETAGFNFRAQVSARTGLVTVEKGVDWPGTGREADAAKAAGMAVDYVQRARTSAGLFGGAPAAPVDHAALGHVVADAHQAADGGHGAPAAAHGTAPTAHGDLSVGNGGLEFWQKLVDGNLRFVSGKVGHPNQSMARIEETAQGQHPFAIVVSCSDSRVPPEVLFDQGIGDLFVVRTAGEVVTEVELGSIEYAVEHLGASYLVVLGHKKCGAVDATLKGGDLPPNIEAIAAQIRPAVEASRFFKGDALDNAVRENAKTVLAKIKGSEIIAEALHGGKLNVKAAYYDIDTGKVAALP